MRSIDILEKSVVNYNARKERCEDVIIALNLKEYIQIREDLKMVKFLKDHYGLTYYDPNNPYIYHMIINLSTNKEYEKLVKWLNENIL